MSASAQTRKNPEFMAPPNAVITTTPQVSHEPQHRHHHQMTPIISSNLPRSAHSHNPHHDTRSHPRSNLTYAVRSGIPTDLDAIHKIYTYYALNSSITLLVHAPDIKYIQKAYEASISRHMPYFVAVTKLTNPSRSDDPPVDLLRDDEGANNQNSNAVDIQPSHQDTDTQEVSGTEAVLGYGHVVPLHADKAGYGPAVELTIYVHPSYLDFGIGSALLSALVSQLRERPILVFEDGYQDRPVERLAEVIVSRMSNDLERDFEGVKMAADGDDEYWPVWKAQGEKNKEWYLRKGFEEVGRMKRVGEKFGKKTDVIILQKSLIHG